MKLTAYEKQKIFYESFDMFKDDWQKNRETITQSISQVASFDMESAIQMWVYILEKNSQRIKSDSDITGGILRALPEVVYDAVAKNSFIKNSLYLNSAEPWESIGLITYFLKKNKFYTVNELFEIILQNKNKSEYNFSDFKSSNISTCLYYVLGRLCDFNEDDIDFLSEWIERVDDVNEKMKLKVLLLSKEKKTDSFVGYDSIPVHTQKLNNYLLENASLEDTELVSSDREKFEIKKIIEFICNGSISKIDFLKLDISWLNCVFENSAEYSVSNFNIIGAYYTIQNLSWNTQRLLRNIYQEKVKIESLWNNPYARETEFSVKQKLSLIQEKLNEKEHCWKFSKIPVFSSEIIKLYKSYKEYINALSSFRDQELQQYHNVSIDSIAITTRVKNILFANQISTISDLVKFIDSGNHLDGLGDKSIAGICDLLSDLGISKSKNSVKGDIGFILNYFHIQANIDQVGVHEIVRLLGIDNQIFGWDISRSKLKEYLENQSTIAEYFLANYSESNSLTENLLFLKKDDTSIYVPGMYFFSSISMNSFLRNY